MNSLSQWARAKNARAPTAVAAVAYGLPLRKPDVGVEGLDDYGARFFAALRMTSMRGIMKDKIVMVTGATNGIGYVTDALPLRKDLNGLFGNEAQCRARQFPG
jgi:hypothetical protein